MIENRKYEKLSDDNQFDYHMIAPERGRILDRKMRLLAGNMDGFSLVLKWNKNINVDEIISKISNVININEKDLNKNETKKVVEKNTKQNKPSTKAPNKKPLNDKPKVDKKISQETKKPVKKEPAIREIVKKPKEKAKIPTRASNDPRYKS